MPFDNHQSNNLRKANMKGVSLVYLGRNDDEKREMYKMCVAIAKKLAKAGIPCQQTNLDSGKALPQPSQVQYEEVWFCGHSRFVEANRFIRKSKDRDLGGFSMLEIAEFLQKCVNKGCKKIRLICCESAQQLRYEPKELGEPPDDLSRVLGNELLEDLGHIGLRHFNAAIDAQISHLEGLILAMAELWQREKNANQRAFDICGLWGAGDITDDNVPITSFLQDAGSLQAQEQMNDPKAMASQRENAERTFKNAHCQYNERPDFFGYSIRQNLFVGSLVPTSWK
jgi:hypothetical protein